MNSQYLILHLLLLINNKNDLSKSLSDSSSIDLSIQKTDYDGPALIEGSDDEIGSEFINMEMDELNLHPCMVPMVCLLKHMETSGIIPSNEIFSQSIEMPAWMICMYKKFSDPLLTFNIKLFLMRLIIHTHTIFKPYARYWLTPIIHMCNQMFENSSEGLNTFYYRYNRYFIILAYKSYSK